MIRILAENSTYRNDSHGYEGVFLLGSGKKGDAKSMALLRRAKNSDTPMLWQVVNSHSTVCFKTLADARQYCRQRGWL